MKVSQLKFACEEFLLEHADTEVKLLWEEVLFLVRILPQLKLQFMLI